MAQYPYGAPGSLEYCSAAAPTDSKTLYRSIIPRHGSCVCVHPSICFRRTIFVQRVLLGLVLYPALCGSGSLGYFISWPNQPNQHRRSALACSASIVIVTGLRGLPVMPGSLFCRRFQPLLTNISSRKSQGLYRCFVFVSSLCLTFRPASPAINSLNTASNSSQMGLANNRTSASLCQPGCLNRGTCDINILTKEATCTCPPPDLETSIYFRGSSCQTEAVRCNETFWCENGGVCQAGLGSGEFTCSCTGAFQVKKTTIDEGDQ